MGFWNEAFAVMAPVPFAATTLAEKGAKNLNAKADTPDKKRELSDDPMGFTLSEGWKSSNPFEKAMTVANPIMGLPIVAANGLFDLKA
jgi:hypothetical protein